MFQRLPDPSSVTVRIFIDGEAFEARAGESVAAALLACGRDHCRTTAVSETPRAPYCMMGVCFDCLLKIDGVSNRQGCLVSVREGMRIEIQRGKRELTA